MNLFFSTCVLQSSNRRLRIWAWIETHFPQSPCDRESRAAKPTSGMVTILAFLFTLIHNGRFPKNSHSQNYPLLFLVSFGSDTREMARTGTKHFKATIQIRKWSQIMKDYLKDYSQTPQGNLCPPINSIIHDFPYIPVTLIECYLRFDTWFVHGFMPFNSMVFLVVPLSDNSINYGGIWFASACWNISTN